VLDMANYLDGRYQLHLEGTVPGSTQPVTTTITFYDKKL
jgi:hypothetical protein